MYTSKVENFRGEILLLSGREHDWQILDIQGLNPPPAQINNSTIAGMDGALYNSAKLNTRNIVIYLKINGDVETNRLTLNNYFVTKEKIKFFYKTKSLDVCIEGRVESFLYDPYNQEQVGQISIICPQPYFKSVEEIVTDFSSVTPLFTFPFAIDDDAPIPFSEIESDESLMVNNPSRDSTGVSVTIDVLENCSSIFIKNTTTNEAMTLVYAFLAGDEIFISTNKGSKSLRLLRNGAFVNLFAAFQTGSTFFQIAPGENYFEYLVNGVPDADALNVKFAFYAQYRGV